MTAADNRIENEIEEFQRAPFSLKGEFRSCWTIWMFLTRLPCPDWVDLHPGFLMRGMCYFPLVGAIIGFIVGVVYDGCQIVLGLPPVVAATASTCAGVIITGCFHEDGLADSADGIGGGWTKKQILTIMTDSRVGTYGCAALILFMVAKIQLLAALDPSNQDTVPVGVGSIIMISQCMARISAPYLVKTHDYIDDVDGPKSSYYHYMIKAKHIVTWTRVGFAVVTSIVVAAQVVGFDVALILFGSVWMTGHFSGKYAYSIFGGVMGDYLGATVCVSEIIILSTLSVYGANKDTIQHEIRNFDLEGTMSLSMSWEEVLARLQIPDEFPAALLRVIVVAASLKVWYFSFGISNVTIQDNSPPIMENIDEPSKSISPEGWSDGRLEAEKICKALDSSFEHRHIAVRAYIDSMAKPVGSLGTFEEWAARLSALQRTTCPSTNMVSCLIFAADHGVAKSIEDGGEACSAYPQVVTQSILKGLEREIAGASVLARAVNVTLKVVDCGVVGNVWDGTVVSSSPQKMEGGSLNFCSEAAMTTMAMKKCLRIGRDELSRILSTTGTKVVVLGEVGIGNTTSSSALIAHFAGVPARLVCGGGATTERHADDEIVKRKIAIVNKALKVHKKNIQNPKDALARLGGAEIVALVGSILQASEDNIALLIDGFIVTAAALVAATILPEACKVMFFATKSDEKGQAAAIEKIQQIAEQNGIVPPSDPALDMRLRMGEGTGGLAAVPLLRSAAAMMQMGTIQDILSS